MYRCKHKKRTQEYNHYEIKSCEGQVMNATPSFNAIQQKAIDLMRSDLRFIYTMIVNIEQLKSNYTVSTLPYCYRWN